MVNKKNKYRYKFSIIMAVYNVEEYLRESIESVVNQTIGFEKNVQLILVNDGSLDNSEEICLEYQEKYPKNIVYIKQKNSGVSSARNKGMKYIDGKFVNFLDSDDKWSDDTLEIVYSAAKKNKKINIFSCKMIFFDGKRGNHQLNYKYKEDKIVDILTDWEYPQLSASSLFINNDVINKHSYDKNIKYSEDNKFVNEIILEQGKYMALKEPRYYYRRRKDSTSAIQNQKLNNDYYINTTIGVYKYLYELSEKHYGSVIKYIQNLVMYELQWRVVNRVPKQIDSEVVREYKTILFELIKKIDDDIILSQKNIFSEYRLEVLCRKYNKDIKKELKTKGSESKNKLYFNNRFVLDITNEDRLTIRNIEYNEKKLKIIGLFNIPLSKEDFDLVCIVDKKEYKLNLENTVVNKRFFIDEEFLSDYGFEIEIPNNFRKICFKIRHKSHIDKWYKLKINFSINSGLNNYIKNFKSINNKIYYCKDNFIYCKSKTLKNSLKFHLRYLKQLLLLSQYGVIFNRFLYYILNKFKRKEIWLISDRTPVANDNGYAFFKYINSIKPDGINTYFIINKDSKDLKKVKKTGKYIYYNSLKYKLYFLLSDKIISSQADTYVTNAFSPKDKFYRDLFNFKFVFLQHGIIKDDLSVWLNKYDKDISIFVTSVVPEYESIIKNNGYGYDSNIVKLTGLPRYDLLENGSESNIIVFMPTWRKNLSKPLDLKTGIRKKNDFFTNSDYYKFYNSLINDQKLIKVMKEKGYKGIFVSHPALSANSEDFDENDTIEVLKGMVNYSELFIKSKLLISDFSSVPFDFGYLKKPIIYTQFDKKTFFQQHSYDEGYFSYEDDGFGPVVYNYEDTVNEIIKYIENDCKLEIKYEKRINNFYKYHDRNNSKRVYEEILKLK